MAAQCSLTAETKANGNLKISEMVLFPQALCQVGGAAGEGVRQAARVLPGLGRGQPLWCSRRLHRRGEDQEGKQPNIKCKVSELVTLENDRKEKLFLEEEARAELFQRVLIIV